MEKFLGEYALNQIYNEDSYLAIKKIKDKSVDCIYIDIPYLYQIGGTSSKLLGVRLQNLYSEIKDISNGINFSIFEEMKRIMKKVNIFIWCSTLQIKDIIDFWCSFPDIKMEIMVWCKKNPVPKNNSLLSDVEYCLWFREKGVKVNGDYFNKSKFYVSSTETKLKKIYKHPTIKPLKMVKNHILCATEINDLVVDFFSGSGTTALACKKTYRNFLCFEINKDYYLNSLKRLDEKLVDETDYEQITLF